MQTVDSIERILDAAEKAFGSLGFAGASMRQICDDANVPQSLIHYHFKSKKGLYRAVFKRRTDKSTEYRRHKIQKLFASNPEPKLEDLVDIFATPPPNFFGEEANGRYYLQMVAQVTIASDDLSESIVREFHDPIAYDMIDAFRRLFPNLSEEKVVWAYLFAVGARQQSYSYHHRAERLVRNGTVLHESPPDLLKQFLTAALQGLADT